MKPFLLSACALLAVILGGVCLWAWAPDRSRQTLNARYFDASHDSFVEVGTPLRVRQSGRTDAPAIVLLHGFGSSLETWEPWADALSDAYRVIRIDLPGSGLSPPDTTDDYSDAHTLGLLRLTMERLGIAKAAWIGNSMGGRLAWKFAAQFPAQVSKLILISPDGFASPGFEYGKAPQVPRVLALMKAFLPRSMLRANLAVAYAKPERLTDAAVTRYYDLLLAAGNRNAMLERMRQTRLQDPRPLLQQIEAPTLLLWGMQDAMIPFANAADYLQALPHARLVSLPSLGHVPHEEAPQVSLPAVREFLAE